MVAPTGHWLRKQELKAVNPFQASGPVSGTSSNQPERFKNSFFAGLALLNPFQAIGSISGNPRERFKKIFFTVLAIHVILFLTLLIQGCRNGNNQTATEGPDSGIVAVQ